MKAEAKRNGFSRFSLNCKRDPQGLIMQPCSSSAMFRSTYFRREACVLKNGNDEEARNNTGRPQLRWSHVNVAFVMDVKVLDSIVSSQLGRTHLIFAAHHSAHGLPCPGHHALHSRVTEREAGVRTGTYVGVHRAARSALGLSLIVDAARSTPHIMRTHGNDVFPEGMIQTLVCRCHNSAADCAYIFQAAELPL